MKGWRFITTGVVLALGVGPLGCDDDDDGPGGGGDAGDTGGDLTLELPGQDTTDETGVDTGVDTGLDTEQDTADVPEDTETDTPAESGTGVLVEAVATDLVAPQGVAVSSGGSTFYFTAFSAEDPAVAGVYWVPSDGSAGANTVMEGAPLVFPVSMAISCDDSTLYVADLGANGLTSVEALGVPVDASVEGGAILTMGIDGSEPTALDTGDLVMATAVVMGPDCATLYVAGYTLDGPVVGTIPAAGGDLEVLADDADGLVMPAAVAVNANDDVAILDHGTTNGHGSIWVLSGIDLTELVSPVGARPGGLAYTLDGQFVLLSGDGGAGVAIYSFNSEDTEASSGDADFLDGGQISRAAEGDISAVVDAEGGAIWRVTSAAE